MGANGSLAPEFLNTPSPASEDLSTGFRLAAPAAVPEPSTYAMTLVGLACGGFFMWRRNKCTAA